VKIDHKNARALCVRATLAVLASLTFTASAQPGGPPDLTGTWAIVKSQSDNPARPRTEDSSKKSGSGVARQVARGISVFGIPVGSLPVPAKREPEPLDVDALVGAEQLLSEVAQIRILQDASATELDYGGAMSATYDHGVRTQDGDRTVHASWNRDVFEVVHELEGGAQVYETYLLDAAGDLHWTVRLKQKKAETRVIERVFTRETRS
jgi:hypothetical protein